jgi:hypothetical protein
MVKRTERTPSVHTVCVNTCQVQGSKKEWFFEPLTLQFMTKNT